MNGIVVDRKDGHAAVLCDDGAIVRIPDAAYELGQRVELHRPARHTGSTLRRIAAIAAAAAAAAALGVGTAYALPCGTVSLDGQTSVEYTINCFDYVLDARPVDSEGARALSGMDMTKLRHRKISAAVAATAAHLERSGALTSGEKPVRITAGTISAAHAQSLEQTLAETVERAAGVPAVAETGAAEPLPGGEAAPAEERALPVPERAADAPVTPEDVPVPAEDVPVPPEDAPAPPEGEDVPDMPAIPPEVPAMPAPPEADPLPEERFAPPADAPMPPERPERVSPAPGGGEGGGPFPPFSASPQPPAGPMPGGALLH